MKFDDLNLYPDLLQGINSVGFETPTPIQQSTIPLILDGYDLIACAQTGTGKTAAYVLPILHHILTSDLNENVIKALIIAPTRELALQIDQQLEGFSYFAGISSIAVYGGGSGSDFELEKKAIKTGTGVVVATPGRLISHLNLGYVNLKNLKFFVLDEADRMLDMGFLPAIQQIVSYLPSKRQTLMFSATMPKEIRTLAKKIMHNPKEITLELAKPPEKVLQAAYFVRKELKTPLLKHLIQDKDLPSILIFVATKNGVKELEKELANSKFDVKAIHSDLDQQQRNETLRLFRNKEVQILVSTDIVSRGIDIEDISLVINYNVPQNAEDYVHRVGRTARAEKTGMAITFVNNAEIKSFKRIEQLIAKEIFIAPLPDVLNEKNKERNRGKKLKKAKLSIPKRGSYYKRKSRKSDKK
ncbi:MAG TPA: DEAD/DEAH box helicase [Bacteroidales bacterium]|nr:DEAD/DEAH box helicase [Bacteroidales bacterium]